LGFCNVAVRHSKIPPGRQLSPQQLWGGRLLVRFFVELLLEAIFEFGADLGNFHSRAHQEFAAQQFMPFFLIQKFACNAAILAILIPAKTSVRDRLRTNVLKTAENRILLGDLERFPQDLDLDQAFVGTKDQVGPARGNYFRHLGLAGL